MNLDFAASADKEQVVEIWRYCFNDSIEYTDYYFKSRYKSENTLVAKDSGNVVSALQLNPYRISFGGKSYDTSYIVGVSTLPHYRGLGIVRKLFDFALDELYKRGELVSILMPIDFSIYRKFGYEAVCEQYMYELGMDMLSGFKPTRRFRLAGAADKDFDILAGIYADFTHGKNLFTLRNSNYYKELLEEIKLDKGGIAMAEGRLGFDGYMAYTLEGDSMIVREIVYTDIDALKSLLGYAYSHKTQVAKVIINTFKNDYIYRVLPDIRNIKLSIKPFLMGRIVNLKGFLESIQTTSSFDPFIMNIEDEMLPENSGCFKISCDSEGFVRVEAAAAGEPVDASMDITALSQLSFGYMSPHELFFIGKISCLDKGVLDSLSAIFKVGLNYFNEYV
ncbi:hypothetical protein EAL2_c12860 [Peptoclostridium acidaminophilum DSM 3953]|uniref:N-acetyltransferase domain-containing protein n=1 Tax=Peptoclostridium acidaminophilum DSM 3953 TaxID=1286171 RepID=W8U6P1_PEPAC|nr:GNAT family N-acetyltransferase [Peptoclostridium acidaminophilum]AHM56581.1 hypothetical protein EAL2_c12860 [Peptoclostridium acidaminophilum DSM 3953]